MNRLTVFQLENIIPEIFGSLDVILISIGPVELDFFTVIRNCVYPIFIKLLP